MLPGKFEYEKTRKVGDWKAREQWIICA